MPSLHFIILWEFISWALLFQIKQNNKIAAEKTKIGKCGLLPKFIFICRGVQNHLSRGSLLFYEPHKMENLCLKSAYLLIFFSCTLLCVIKLASYIHGVQTFEQISLFALDKILVQTVYSYQSGSSFFDVTFHGE
jgi:hypothetical protein